MNRDSNGDMLKLQYCPLLPRNHRVGAFDLDVDISPPIDRFNHPSYYLPTINLSGVSDCAMAEQRVQPRPAAILAADLAGCLREDFRN